MIETLRNVVSSDATTQKMIAPVIDTLVAIRAWAIGEQFIYAGVLYKVTSAIAVGGTITIGTNCTEADTLTEQVIEIVRTGVTVSANGTVRIPESGTDSRISTSKNQIITVVADLISNRPAKYKTLTVYDGYVNIVMAEALSNKSVGIQITNYS